MLQSCAFTSHEIGSVARGQSAESDHATTVVDCFRLLQLWENSPTGKFPFVCLVDSHMCLANELFVRDAMGKRFEPYSLS